MKFWENAKVKNCEECGKRFKNAKQCKVHIDEVHLKIKNFQCDLCDDSFTRKEHLENHKNSSLHENNLPFQCPICKKRFGLSWNFNTHVALHEEKKPYQCELCDKYFALPRYLKTHTESVHEKKRPHYCSICNKYYASKSVLNSHNKSFHDF